MAFMKRGLISVFPHDLLCEILNLITDPYQIRSCALVCVKWGEVVRNSPKLSVIRRQYSLFYAYLDGPSVARFRKPKSLQEPHSSVVSRIIAQDNRNARKYNSLWQSLSLDPKQVIFLTPKLISTEPQKNTGIVV
jgi:hypothetical protein